MSCLPKYALLLLPAACGTLESPPTEQPSYVTQPLGDEEEAGARGAFPPDAQPDGDTSNEASSLSAAWQFAEQRIDRTVWGDNALHYNPATKELVIRFRHPESKATPRDLTALLALPIAADARSIVLSLSGTPSMTNIDMLAIATAVASAPVVDLDLSETSPAASVFSALSTSAYLTHLRLNRLKNTPLKRDTFEALQNLKTLKYISLHRQPISVHTEVIALLAKTTVETIDLSDTIIANNGSFDVDKPIKAALLSSRHLTLVVINGYYSISKAEDGRVIRITSASRATDAGDPFIRAAL